MPKPYGAGLPDFKYINRIPITDAAGKIGLEFSDDGRIVCPCSDKHKDGGTALLTALPRNKVKCEACNTGPLGVVDLMMHIGNFSSARDAVLCFASDLRSFDVPTIPKGSHLKNPDCLIVPPACEDPICLLVLSGVWADLSVTAQRLIPVLLNLGRWEESGSDCTIRISYRAMMRYSGIESPNAIKDVLDELENIGWLVRLGSPQRGESPIKGTAEYRLTPLSQGVMELANKMAPQFGAAIQAAKAARKRQRQEREQRLRSRR